MEETQTLVGLNASFGNPFTRAFSAQLAFSPSYFSEITLVNTSPGDRRVELRALADNGNPVGDAVEVTLSAREVYRKDLSQIFQLDREAEPVYTASLQVEADAGGVIGHVLFGDPLALGYAAALPLQMETFREAVFSHVAAREPYFTGLAAYNPGEETAEVTVEIYSPAGDLTGRETFLLEPSHRLARLVAELVEEAAGQQGGYIRVGSTHPLVAQQLFGDVELRSLSAVPPTLLR